MRIYLAGPMRGYPDNNASAFVEATVRLRGLGHEVWSPIEADAQADDLGILACMQRDLPALMQQQAVVLLDDWNRSHGACLERHVADVVGLQVFYYEPKIPGSLIRASSHDWRWKAGAAFVP